MRTTKLIVGAVLITAGLTWLLTSGSAASVKLAPAPQGAAVFAEKCASCHGKDGKGLPQWRAKGQPDFTDEHFQKSITDQEISDVIHTGKGKYMPSFKDKLSEDQIASVVKQVRAFGKK